MGMFGARYDTRLDPEQEARFRAWQARLPSNLQSDEDYDLRGAFVANAQAAANGHLPDTFKKPNHMTFSDQSQYSTPQAPGGHWYGSEGDPRWVFLASPANLRYHTLPELSSYFQQYEPDSTLVLQSDYRLPRGG